MAGPPRSPARPRPAWATLGDPRKDDSKPDSTRQELDALDLEHCLGSLRLLAMVFVDGRHYFVDLSTNPFGVPT